MHYQKHNEISSYTYRDLRLLSKRQEITISGQGYRKKGMILLVGMQTCTTSMENNMEVPQESKNVTLISSNNPTFGYIAKGKNSHKISQNITSNSYLYYVYSIIIHNSQGMQTT